MQYVDEDPHKYKSIGLCVCVWQGTQYNGHCCKRVRDNILQHCSVLTSCAAVTQQISVYRLLQPSHPHCCTVSLSISGHVGKVSPAVSMPHTLGEILQGASVSPQGKHTLFIAELLTDVLQANIYLSGEQQRV